MAKDRQYKIIFLDWDGTLCGSRFWGHWETGDNSHIYEIIQNEFFIRQKEFLLSWMRGDKVAEDCAILLSELTARSSDELLFHLEKSCKEMQFISEKIPYLIQKLKDKGVEVVLATDNMDTFIRWTIPALGLRDLVDDILDSYSLKALKRDILPSGESAFFTAYLSNRGLTPSKAILIDDSSKNICVKEFGMDYIQVTKNNGIVEILDSLTAQVDYCFARYGNLEHHDVRSFEVPRSRRTFGLLQDFQDNGLELFLREDFREKHTIYQTKYKKPAEAGSLVIPTIVKGNES